MKTELWGGVECTVNRVGSHTLDQCARSGHMRRLSDLDSFAAMGVSALRTPVLWEHVAPDGNLASADWSLPDAMLARLRSLGIRPIVGLLHHGSGPPHTCLTHEGFVEQFVAYARACALRYPWVREWTPINEPLTTARFSALYGLWYPHARSSAQFARALVNQCRAIARAMREIRAVQPLARLVQTEDLGFISATPRLQYQADYENLRRWLSLDMLAGRADESHPLWGLLMEGASRAEARELVEQPCPANVIGINRYVTSDRYLDERLDRYPVHCHGGNGRERYADVESVRVPGVGLLAHEQALLQAWERYRTELALTEVHLDCTREEQMRWFYEAWRAAQHLGQQAIPVRAVTAWSLLGSYDWNSLVTLDRGYYEPGVYDLRSEQPRPTAMVPMLRALARDGHYDHPVLDQSGWWHGVVDRTEGHGARPLVIMGARGTLGQALARACRARGIHHVLLHREHVDIASPRSVRDALELLRPWAVVNAAGYVKVDQAEHDRAACFRANAVGAEVLARACASFALPLVTFSSDLVFDGNSDRPYVEDDRVGPLNVYGASKAAAEQRVLAAHDGALIIRTSAFFGPWDRYNFVTLALRRMLRGEPVRVADDQMVSPTYVPDLARLSLDLLIDGERGVWHLANAGAVSWAELAGQVARMARVPAHLVQPAPSSMLGLKARRPKYSALGSGRGSLMPSLHGALERYLADRES